MIFKGKNNIKINPINKKKKTKKGFTLVELLVIMVIIVIISTIGVLAFNSSSHKTKENMYNIKIDSAHQSVKLWAHDNLECFRTKSCTDKITSVDCIEEGLEETDECYIMSLKTLADEGYYDFDDKDNIINPIDNSIMNDEQILLVYNRKSNKVNNHPLRTYLYKVVAFDPSLQSTQNHTVTINNLYKVNSVKSDTGISSYTTNQDDITISFSEGIPTSTQWNSQFYSREENASSTSNFNTFDITYYYDDGEYSGTLDKNGSSTVISGEYVEDDTKYVSGQTSSNYNSGGYSGTLTRYVYSGSYTPEDSFVADVTLSDGWSTWHMEYRASGWAHLSSSKSNRGSTYYYNSGGYSGTLTRYTDWVYKEDPHYSTIPNPYIGQKYDWTRYWKYSFSGVVTRPASDTRVYRYAGYVTKPGYDTRIWEQNYSGTVYKGGDEHLYSYKATIAYKINN